MSGLYGDLPQNAIIIDTTTVWFIGLISVIALILLANMIMICYLRCKHSNRTKTSSSKPQIKYNKITSIDESEYATSSEDGI